MEGLVITDMPNLPEGYTFLGFPELGSTSDFARDMAEDWFAENEMAVWVWTAMQTSGRGRRGREWVAREGNLSATLLMRPECDAQRGAELSFVAALAVSDVLQSLSPIQAVELKWPNDVLLGGKKIAGLLLESAGAAGGKLEWLSIGCGVNLTWFPEDMPFAATSMEAAGIEPPSSIEFLEHLAAAFVKRHRNWVDGGFASVRTAWLQRARGQGEAIEARLGEETITGTFRDLDETGALMLELPDGSIRKVTAGEVFFV